MNESVKKVFFKRKITYLVIFATLIAVYVISASATEFHLSEGLASFPKAMAWIGHNLMPDEKAMERFPKILDKLIETALLYGSAVSCRNSNCGNICFLFQFVRFKGNRL